MSGLNVTVEIAILSKFKTALWANEWLLIRMRQFMTNYFGFDAKSFKAYVATVIFFARVRRRVCEHLLSSTKFFVAIRARMGKLVCMKFAMNVEAGFWFERFRACLATVRTLPGVRSTMIVSGCLWGETVAANVAGKLLELGVNVFEVTGQTTGFSKLFAANVTGVWSLVPMDSRVSNVGIFKAKLLGALRAFVNF